MSAAVSRATQVQGRYRARLAGALAVSLLLHGFMLSLQFGLPGLGVPSLELPSRERRAQASDLELIITGAVKTPSAAQQPASLSESTSSTAPPSGLRLVPAPLPAPESKPKRTVRQLPAEPRSKTHRPKPDNPVIALNDARERRFDMPAPAPDELPSLLESEPAAKTAPPAVADDLPPEPTASAQEQESRRVAEEAERHAREAAQKLEAEAKERETARLREEESARQAQVQEAARLEEQKKRDEEARLALQTQQEEATQRALELEEKGREEARLQAEKARRKELELQARRQAEEAARQQAIHERQEAELAARRKADADAVAQREAERLLMEGGDATRRTDPLPRSVGGGLAGRALDQARRPELLRTDPPATRQANGNDGTRRRSIFGSNEKDVSVMMYAESWRLKIERNGSLNYSRSAVDKAARDPVVSVTIRSDGSVEDVVIHQSSGRPELDEAIHRIVRVNARFSAFPPDLARRFDVIEIRRVWSFDDRLRILEEVR